VLTEDDTLTPLGRPAFAAASSSFGYDRGEESDLRGPLFLIALALLALDTLAVLWINGRLNPCRPGGVGGRDRNGTVSLCSRASPPCSAPAAGFAQQSDERPGDDEIIELLETTRLAYVTTGNAQTDEVSAAGLWGLTRYLQSRTALEPAEPVGLDLETDELAFYPLIYFPIDTGDADAERTGDLAPRRLHAGRRHRAVRHPRPADRLVHRQPPPRRKTSACATSCAASTSRRWSRFRRTTC
jgi:hypothetical protein